MTHSFASTTSAGQFIAGHWVKTKSTAFRSLNPATGDIVWEGMSAANQAIDEAYESALQALPAWRALGFEKRAAITRAFAQCIESKREALAHLIALETGKPLWEAYTEVSSVINKINISINAVIERNAEKEEHTEDALAAIRYKPQGVVVVLGAFNFPAHLSNGHIVPALLAGNTVLYKPSEMAPAVAEFILHCWQESGIPSGVINGLQGDGKVGSALLAKDIQGVYFTGSFTTGLSIHEQFAKRPEVILALEMGGNNPLIVSEVKDIKAALYHTLISSFITAGQRCSCARRLILPNNAWGDTFLSRLIKASRALKVGAFNDRPEPFMGPVISHNHALAHLNAQLALSHAGGEILQHMTLLTKNTGLLSPGIIDMTRVKEPFDEEIFAPLLQVFRYKSFEDALTIANNTRYGLVAGLLSDDAKEYHAFYNTIRAGLINWNRPTTGASSNLPFGGIGKSGNHRPSAYFAADYCAYPVASLEQPFLSVPAQPLPGITMEHLS